MSCENIFPITVPGVDDSERLLMVTSCLNNVNANLCLNGRDTLEEVFPVISEDKYIYRNKYWAECNLVNYTRLVLSARCKEPQNLNISLFATSSIDNLKKV